MPINPNARAGLMGTPTAPGQDASGQLTEFLKQRSRASQAQARPPMPAQARPVPPRRPQMPAQAQGNPQMPMPRQPAPAAAAALVATPAARPANPAANPPQIRPLSSMSGGPGPGSVPVGGPGMPKFR